MTDPSYVWIVLLVNSAVANFLNRNAVSLSFTDVVTHKNFKHLLYTCTCTCTHVLY